MRLQYVREQAVVELRKSIVQNEASYKQDEVWIDKFFSDRQFLAESRIDLKSLPELIIPDQSGRLFDLENAIAVHSALRQLTPSQAADERLWVWLAHVYYWEYMRKRWPVEGAPNVRAYVLEHYFLGDARSLVRNGLARLWWFGHSTYDEKLEDPYALTPLLLHTSDARQQLLERKFWRNRPVFHSMLKRIDHWRAKELDFYVPRERFRRLCKRVNSYGGTLLLDALNEASVFELVDDIAAMEHAEAQQASA